VIEKSLLKKKSKPDEELIFLSLSFFISSLLSEEVATIK